MNLYIKIAYSIYAGYKPQYEAYFLVSSITKIESRGSMTTFVSNGEQYFIEEEADNFVKRIQREPHQTAFNHKMDALIND